MEKIRAAIDALMTDGRQIAGCLKEGLEEIDDYRVSWGTAVFRGKFGRAQRILRESTSRCLKYELDASDLLQRVAHHAAEGGQRRPAAEPDMLGLQAQRDTVRMLLGTLGGSVADFKGRCDSRVTNAINFLILVLTVSSIAVAIISYYVAKNSYDVAKNTYDDAVSSGTKQEQSMKIEIETLEKQEKALGAISTDARKQANYLASEQAKERKRRELDEQRGFDARLQESAESLRAYYEGLYGIVQQLIPLHEMYVADTSGELDKRARTLIDVYREELPLRIQMAGTLSEVSLALKEGVGSGDFPPSLLELEREVDKLHALDDGKDAAKAEADSLRLLHSALSALAKEIQEGNQNDQRQALWNAVKAIHLFFSREAPLYEEVNEQYVIVAKNSASILVTEGFTDPSIALSPALSPFGISAHIAADSADAEKYNRLTRLRIERSAEDQKRAFRTKTSSIEESLEFLEMSLMISLRD